MTVTETAQLSQAIIERLDNITNILVVLLAVCGLILGSVLFRHFRK